MYTTAANGGRLESAQVHRRAPAWVASIGAALSALLMATAARAQTIEYDVTVIPPVGGVFFTTVPFGINNSGEVVGWAQASGPEFFLRAWKWSAQEGLILLPPPPGSASDRYGARDISDNGIIVGDEGGGGVSWRFQDGVYTIIQPLPTSLFASTASGVNDGGDVAGSSGGQGATDPRKATLFTDEAGLVNLTPTSFGAAIDINNARQIAGWANSGGVPFVIEAFRITPGIGMEFLGFPPGTNITRAWAINELGDVVGKADLSPNVSRGFLFTDEGGMQALPNTTNSRNAAAGINIHRQVVGIGTGGAPNGWVWTAQTGTRNLTDLIDPALGLAIQGTRGINDRGQIIATGSDLDDSINPNRILLLTPTIVPGDINGDGVADLNDLPVFVAVVVGTDTDPLHVAAANMNGDAAADGKDIQAFVKTLLGP